MNEIDATPEERLMAYSSPRQHVNARVREYREQRMRQPEVKPANDPISIEPIVIQSSVWPKVLGKICELIYLTIVALLCTIGIILAVRPELMVGILAYVGWSQ